MEQEFIIVEWSKGRRKLFKAYCSTCSKDRGYKRPDRAVGNCKSCQKKIDLGTFGLIKKCIKCNTTEVNDPSKDWFAGPTCNRCYSKTYRRINKDKIRESIDKWRSVNKEQFKNSEKLWRQKNKDHKCRTDTIWREANKDHCRIARRKYEQHRLNTDPCFKIAKALRHRLNEALKTNQKVGSAVNDLGCSIKEFKVYLEDKFHPHPMTGQLMTWDNHTLRGWHIDHIVPLISFDLTDRDQLLKACHYTNMQPLWWRDNIVKGTKNE